MLNIVEAPYKCSNLHLHFTFRSRCRPSLVCVILFSGSSISSENELPYHTPQLWKMHNHPQLNNMCFLLPISADVRKNPYLGVVLSLWCMHSEEQHLPQKKHGSVTLATGQFCLACKQRGWIWAEKINILHHFYPSLDLETFHLSNLQNKSCWTCPSLREI